MTFTEAEIKQYKHRQEALIEMHGFVVQNVTGGVDKFSYTIGRNDRHEKDFLLLNATPIALDLLEEVVELDKTNNLICGKIYESKILVLSVDHSKKTRFRVSKTKLDDYAHLVLGIVNRYTNKSRDDIHLYLVEVGDESNNFPDEL